MVSSKTIETYYKTIKADDYLKSPIQDCVLATRWKLTATFRLLVPWNFWFRVRAFSRNLSEISYSPTAWRIRPMLESMRASSGWFSPQTIKAR